VANLVTRLLPQIPGFRVPTAPACSIRDCFRGQPGYAPRRFRYKYASWVPFPQSLPATAAVVAEVAGALRPRMARVRPRVGVGSCGRADVLGLRRMRRSASSRFPHDGWRGTRPTSKSLRPEPNPRARTAGQLAAAAFAAGQRRTREFRRAGQGCPQCGIFRGAVSASNSCFTRPGTLRAARSLSTALQSVSAQRSVDAMVDVRPEPAGTRAKSVSFVGPS
jgi:hypothetical protein